MVLSSGHSDQPQFPYVLNRRWQVTDKLGQGGMGTVFMAQDLNLPNLSDQKRSCVVKQLKDDFFREEDREKALQFFIREAQVLASLSHPNIVRVLDFFTQDGRSFLVMEYVEGLNLHEMLVKRQEPFDEEKVLEWAVQICDVLHYLHTHNPPVIYRDLKPSNIMIDVMDHVKLVDFGIARPYEDTEDNTHVVSQGYSPPEQYWGAADPRSDIYALGCTMYFLLTGQDPAALTVAAPQKLNPDVSDHLDSIIQRATQQDIWSRYQSALEMKDELTFPREKHTAGRPRPLLVACLLIVLSGLFLGGLKVLAMLSEQMQTAQKNVTEYSAEREALEADRKRIEAEREELKKAKMSIFQNALQAATGNNSNSGSSSGPNPGSSAPAASASLPKFPNFQESDEIELTDPEGLK
ncbi:MAG: serine/threonine protein kinase [Cyanobacteria bacterium HKST-UBA02]|nr:serine/threonine protein kinase [Cyanobacteria bacterium HKST-UBA02]